MKLLSSLQTAGTGDTGPTPEQVRAVYEAIVELRNAARAYLDNDERDPDMESLGDFGRRRRRERQRLEAALDAVDAP